MLEHRRIFGLALAVEKVIAKPKNRGHDPDSPQVTQKSGHVPGFPPRPTCASSLK